MQIGVMGSAADLKYSQSLEDMKKGKIKKSD